MTEETRLMAYRALEQRGFADKQPDHPWNLVHHEREFDNEAIITVWGRDHTELIVVIQSGDYKTACTLIETSNEETLTQVLDKTIELLELAAALTERQSVES